MRIGYPAINTTIQCTSNSTFRLKSYLESRLIDAVTQNLNCLKQILLYNRNHGFLFFRIGSNIIPFASHPICQSDWVNRFEKQFKTIGKFIKHARAPAPSPQRMYRDYCPSTSKTQVPNTQEINEYDQSSHFARPGSEPTTY